MSTRYAMPGPNEPCWCGSTRKYKQCHRAIDLAAPEDKYSEAQRIYAVNWRVTADAQSKRGDYDWMSRQLKKYGINRLLDIGCGSGHGILSMLSEFGSDLRVVAVDENPSCLSTTKDTLQKAGHAPALVSRIETQPTNFGYRSVYSAITEELPAPICLLQADVCSDPHLLSALQADGLFDAVTVWLNGVHMQRQDHEVVRDAGVESDYAHRLFVQNAAYELADKVLRSGGVLQVVDRGESLSNDALTEDILRSHREQAGPTTLDVIEVDHTPWSAPEGKRVPMVQTPGTSGRVANGDMALISVISVKS
ncbi:SEC-C metal-binding domain-containing protein [Neorhizobium sp. BT27B]|uniref:SEC-C metal-binding domain-containing protein n=1 Tax=Neorhizobium sp. BT27B TaxID=3142625 RepID=UPI003D2BD5B0